jgi:5-methylcytosine-specific restriction endonuclease McrA
MFASEHEPLALLVELTPKLAKKRFRDDIYKAWDHKCGYCGDTATSLDHIVPRFKSGSSNRYNLLPACRRCNSNKASTPMAIWFEEQEYFTQAKMDRIKNWMRQETMDLFGYQLEHLSLAV